MWPKKFPIHRVLVAELVVSMFTIVLLQVPSLYYRSNLTVLDFGMVLWHAIWFSWFGWAVFLILAGPTLYVLHRLRRTGVGWFMFFAAIYTSLPFVVVKVVSVGFLDANIAGFWPLYLLGAVNGILVGG